MTPGARIKTATDILEILMRTGEPADRYLKGWAAKNRYAGSKDRRFLRELIFDATRHRASYEAAMGAGDARALVLAATRWGQGTDLAALESACSGEGHNAAPLTDAERGALGAAAAPQVVEWPAWALAELGMGREATEAEALANALNEMAPIDLRVNTAKAKRADVLSALEAVGFAARATPFSPVGIRIARDGAGPSPNVRGLPLFQDGRIEIQDEGSQIVALLAAVQPGEQVAELCAGGGGKTLVLGSALGGKGQLYACDVDEKRLRAGQARVKRAGLHVVQPGKIASWDPAAGGQDPDLEELAGAMDCVYLDVPCSGSGAWRRQPDGKWNLSPERLEELLATQAAILRRGARLVKPGGRLVYVTCSVFARENQNQVEAFLDGAEGFTPAPLKPLWEANVSQPFPVALEDGLVDGHTLPLSPISSGTDGFFFAAFTRTAG
jgi:16S rRNA (cytosine967-C5)-methyltransferase